MTTERCDVVGALAEVFREHGYEGASLALISRATGLGKGSLYNMFPGGKDEMASSVLADVDAWFEANVFARLRDEAEPAAGIRAMFDAVAIYFRSGRRTCLVGALALTDARDRFGPAVNSYFARWVEALAGALRRSGRFEAEAAMLAEDIIGGIQGAIVLARAVDDATVFERVLARMRARVTQAH